MSRTCTRVTRTRVHTKAVAGAENWSARQAGYSRVLWVLEYGQVRVPESRKLYTLWDHAVKEVGLGAQADSSKIRSNSKSSVRPRSSTTEMRCPGGRSGSASNTQTR